jgi:hypothetical protein
MSAQIFVPLLFGVVLAVYAGIAVVTWRRTRGQRVVTCPEMRKLAAVELDTGHAVVTALWESADLRVKKCSRWPEHRKCDQGCLPAAASARTPHR